MKKFPYPDNKHLDAAEGWLGLGNWREANEELENIAPKLRAHPYVLELGYEIYSAAKKWDGAVEIAGTMARLLPDNPWGHFHLAFSLHELKRTKEAYETLKPVVDKFPKEYLMPHLSRLKS
jgi:predicted Zn-dependent protease